MVVLVWGITLCKSQMVLFWCRRFCAKCDSPVIISIMIHLWLLVAITFVNLQQKPRLHQGLSAHDAGVINTYLLSADRQPKSPRQKMVTTSQSSHHHLQPAKSQGFSSQKPDSQDNLLPTAMRGASLWSPLKVLSIKHSQPKNDRPRDISTDKISASGHRQVQHNQLKKNQQQALLTHLASLLQQQLAQAPDLDQAQTVIVKFRLLPSGIIDSIHVINKVTNKIVAKRAIAIIKAISPITMQPAIFQAIDIVVPLHFSGF